MRTPREPGSDHFSNFAFHTGRADPPGGDLKLSEFTTDKQTLNWPKRSFNISTGHGRPPGGDLKLSELV